MTPDRDPDPLVQPADPETSSAAPAGEPAPAPVRPTGSGKRGGRRKRSENMLPQRDHARSWPERLLVRLIATFGVVGVGVAIGAIMTSSNSQGWMVGLVVSIVSVVLAGVLWSSRML
jgi:hypothetical protein